MSSGAKSMRTTTAASANMDDVYYKKTLTFNFWKHRFQFKVSQDLFSSHDVDLGTQFLLRTIVEGGYPAPKKILDLGCGYGPLGLILKALNPAAAVQLVDKDALALDYCRQNAALNNLEVNVEAGLGYDSLVTRDFDLIVSNIPGKAGLPVIKYMLEEGRYRLAPGGIIVVVVVDPLEANVDAIFAGLPGVEVLTKRKRPGHVVWHYRFPAPAVPAPSLSALERGIYTRNSFAVSSAGLSFRVKTAWGLPEFDSLDFRTELLLRGLVDIKSSLASRIGVFNPGQGHSSVALQYLFQPSEVAIVDRDLLALEFARLNLIANGTSPAGIRPFHVCGFETGSPEDRFDLIAGILREEEGQAAVLQTVRQAQSALSPQGTILVVGGATAITRLAAYLQTHKLARVNSRAKLKGNGLLALSR